MEEAAPLQMCVARESWPEVRLPPGDGEHTVHCPPVDSASALGSSGGHYEAKRLPPCLPAGGASQMLSTWQHSAFGCSWAPGEGPFLLCTRWFTARACTFARSPGLGGCSALKNAALRSPARSKSAENCVHKRESKGEEQ